MISICNHVFEGDLGKINPRFKKIFEINPSQRGWFQLLFLNTEEWFFPKSPEKYIWLLVNHMVCVTFWFISLFCFFLTATKSKNPKVPIDVRIFKTFEFLSPRLISNFFRSLITRENPGVYYGDVRCGYTDHVIKHKNQFSFRNIWKHTWFIT